MKHLLNLNIINSPIKPSPEQTMNIGAAKGSMVLKELARAIIAKLGLLYLLALKGLKAAVKII